MKVPVLLFFLFLGQIFSESISTTLNDEKQVQTFHVVTSKIRCICLPSLPIKSCSFNNCEISALLKFFIENQIRKGMTSEEIIQKMQTGFGKEVIDDPIVQKLLNSGNEGMVNNIVFGFGEKILAEPDSFPINLTIGLFGLLGIVGIFLYFKKNSRSSQPNPPPQKKDSNLDKYLKELD